MRDEFNIPGQAGAVGPNAYARDMNFQQIWNQNAESINLDELAKDLVKLRKALKKEAIESDNVEHDKEIAAIAHAEEAAKKKDGPRVIQWLSKAGKWTLDTATTIGTEIASAAIKASLGL